MYRKILKKDLKHNKSFNVVLLIFIILASTFISSSINNLIAVTKGLDSFFDKVELSDYIILVSPDMEDTENIDGFLKDNKHVDSYKEDDLLAILSVDLGNDMDIGQLIINSFDINQQKFLDEKNNIITHINDGEIYVPNKFLNDYNFSLGDEITLSVDNSYSNTYIIAGTCKDAFLGSSFVENVRFIMNDKELAKLKEEINTISISCFSVDLNNLDGFTKDFNKLKFNVDTVADRELVKMMYVMDMVMAGVLLFVSVCLILIAFLILRFTIIFTINEEYHDIGVMKAIGIKSRKIRSLYVIKYLAIAFVGAIVGAILSTFWGPFLLKGVSMNIALESGSSEIVVRTVCSIILVIIIVSYSFVCTKRINKITPVEAIRAGESSETFKIKNFLRLRKTKLPTYIFLALNDIFSSFKKFLMLIITFTIGFLLIIIMLNTKNTLRSGNLVTLFAMAPSDVFMTNPVDQLEFIHRTSPEEMTLYYKNIEGKLKDKGIDAEVFCETLLNTNVIKAELSTSTIAYYGSNIKADRYTYTKGIAPKLENEIALTEITAKEIDATIGDRVKVKSADQVDEYIVTAFFESMNSLGAGIRYSEKSSINNLAKAGQYGIQVLYLDNPTNREKKERLKTLEELMPDYDIKTADEYISDFVGGIANDIDSFSKLTLSIILIINILVTVLMVKSFLIKEKKEVALLKSLGFRNKSLLKWQVTRVGIILLVSIIIATILSTPLSQIIIVPIFEMMGASQINFEIKPLEVFLIYPIIIFTVTLIASAITALGVKKLAPQEVINID